MAESRYGPGWVRADCPDKRGGGEGNDCAHLARVTDEIRGQFLKERGAPLLVDTTYVVRDEHGNWLQLTTNEAWGWVRGAKAGDFDSLFDSPPAADPTPVDPLLERAYELLANAQPHGVLEGAKAVEWSRVFEQWRDGYHAALKAAHGPQDWSCSA